MSEFSQILTDAADEAQGVIAQMMGMDETDPGNFLYNGRNFIGVFGQAIVVEIPLLQGGYRRRSQLPLTVTRTQADFVPVAKSAPIVRLAPRINYTIDHVDPNDPLLWVLTLVKVGE